MNIMATLSANFNKLDNLIEDLDDLEDYYNSRIDTVNSSYSSVSAIYNEFGYLTSAKRQLSDKVNELETNRDKITAFKNELSDFRTLAYDEESGLADRIFLDSDAFMDEMGITPEYEKSAWDKFCDKVEVADEWLTDIVQGVAEFVIENWDQILTVVGEILIAAAAIATFIGTFPVSGVIGALSMVAAGWSAFKAVTELMGDVASLGYSIIGEDELAEEAANYDARQLFEDAGEAINDTFDWEYGDELMDVAYIAFDTIELVYNVKDIFKESDPITYDEFIEGMHTTINSNSNNIEKYSNSAKVVEKIGNTVKNIPDKGIFAISNWGDAGQSTAYEIFDKGYDYFDATSAIVTDSLEENGVISENTHNSIDNAVGYGKFIKDLYNDNKKMSNLLGKAEVPIESTLGKAIMEEGNIQESLSYLIGLSEG